MSAQIAPAPASAGSTGGVPSHSSSASGSPPSHSAQSQGSPPVAGGEPSASQGGENNVPGARPGETPQQTVQRFKSVQRVNGKDVEIEASLDELFQAKRRESAVQDNARKVAEARKKHEAEVAAFQEHARKRKEDPFFEFRDQPNFNELEFLQQRMHRLLNDQNKDPRDLELSAKDQRIKELERLEVKRQTEAKQAQEHAEENRQLAQLGAKFQAALKQGELPEDDLTLDMMAKAYFTAEEEGDLDLSEAELVTETRRMMTGALDNCAEKMDGEALLNHFPKFAKKVHEALLSRYKKMQAGGGEQRQTQVPTANVAPQRPPQEKRMTERELHEWEQQQSGRRFLRGL